MIYLAYALLCTHSLLASTCYATCYQLNGTQVTTEESPCNANVVDSMCCEAQNSRSETESCLPNGLCENVRNSSTYGITKTYSRKSCTDPSWDSPYCLRLLDVCSADEDGIAEVTPCPNNNNTFCCGADYTGCCGTRAAISLAATLTPTTSSGSVNESNASSSNNDTGLSSGAAAGIGIGSAFAATMLTLTILWCLRSRKQNERVRAEKSWQTTDMSDQVPIQTHELQNNGQAVHQLEA